MEELKTRQNAPQPPLDSMKTFDFGNLSSADAYKLMIGTIIPRPIALVSTISKQGKTNVAPFSFFNGVCSNPPTLMVSIARKSDGTKKDTLRNIEETGQFVVNGSHEWILDPLVESAATYSYGESEFDITKLTPIPSLKVKPPRVKESAIQFECEVSNILEIGDGSAGASTVVFGKILLLHLLEGAADERKRVNPAVLSPLGRLGGISYTTLGTILDKAVPKVSGSPENS